MEVKLDFKFSAVILGPAVVPWTKLACVLSVSESDMLQTNRFMLSIS